MIVASISTFPVDKGPSLSRYVKKAIAELKAMGMKCHVGPMCTSVEAPDLDTLFEAVKRAHMAIVNEGCVRVLTTVKIDDRRDVDHSMGRKLAAVGEIADENTL